MGLRLVCAWILTALIFLAPAEAADLKQVGPQARAADIIAARGNNTDQALIVTYGFTSDGKPQEDRRMILARDYIATEAGTTLSIADYALDRAIMMNKKDKSFSNLSLYALADFVLAETYNRRMIRGMLDRFGLDQKAKAEAFTELFWSQSELRFADKEDGLPTIVRKEEKGSSVFFYKKQEVARFTASGEILSAEERKAFARVFRQQANVHPEIAQAILDSEKLPERFAFIAALPGNERTKREWVLKSVERKANTYPLDPGFSPESPFGEAENVTAALYPQILQAIAKKAPGYKTQEDYRRAIMKAWNKKAQFQAVLLTFEALLQYGQQELTGCPAGMNPCPADMVKTAQREDKRSRDYLAAYGGSDPKQAVELVRGISRDDLTNGYMIDDMLGNLLHGTDAKDDVAALFASAIRGNPYLAGFYKDAGDVYRFRFDPVTAWVFYDLGRQLPGGPDAPVIDLATQHETRLKTLHPELF